MAFENSLIDTIELIEREVSNKGYNSDYPEIIKHLCTIVRAHINEHANKEQRGRPYEVYPNKEVIDDIVVLSKELSKALSILEQKIVQADDLIQRAGSCMDYVQNKTWGTPVERTIAKLRGEKENGK